MMLALISLIAQAASQPAAPAQRQPSIFEPQFFGVLLVFVFVFYWFIMRPQQKERQRHDALLKGLKRNDRVQTIGGIIATVLEVRDHEVVLKIDESSNVKVRFSRGAIKEVLRDPAATEAAGGKK